jgi:hypothetical protein
MLGRALRRPARFCAPKFWARYRSRTHLASLKVRQIKFKSATDLIVKCLLEQNVGFILCCLLLLMEGLLVSVYRFNVSYCILVVASWRLISLLVVLTLDQVIRVGYSFCLFRLFCDANVKKRKGNGRVWMLFLWNKENCADSRCIAMQESVRVEQFTTFATLNRLKQNVRILLSIFCHFFQQKNSWHLVALL